MKTRTKALLLLLLCCVLSLSACSQQEGSQLKAEEAPKRVAVQTATADRRDLETLLTYPSQIRPAKQINVTSKLAGKVSQVFCDVSDVVRAGDVLFTLDTQDIANNIRSLQGQIATAEAAIQSARTGVYLATGSQLQSQILQASGGVEQAKSAKEQAEIAYSQTDIGLRNAQQTMEQAQLAYDDLQKDYQSSLKLYELGEVTKRQIEQLELGLQQATINIAQATLALEQAELAQSQAQVAVEQAETGFQQAQSSYGIVYNDVPVESLQRAEDALNQALAQRDALRIQLEVAQSTLNDASIRSPITGVVSARTIEAGTMLGQTSVPFVIVDMETVQAAINVSENLINTLSVGQDVALKIAAVQAEPLYGQIEIISPTAIAGTSSYEVRIAIANSDSRIKPGMYAEVFLTKEAQADVLVLPRSAVLEDAHERYIYVIADEQAEKRLVTTGIEEGNDIAILSGLSDGEKVAIKGQNNLSDGALVTETQNDAQGA